jgi:AraC-like DNA-binding protein
VIGHPADELRDHTIELADLWPPQKARELTERVAAAPEPALHRWLTARAADRPIDPLGPAVASMAAAGLSVATMADQVGLSARQLNRRCQPLFGYGPGYLSRIFRLGRALEQARANRPLAETAALSGYFDQAHLAREVRALTGTTPTRLLAELS